MNDSTNLMNPPPFARMRPLRRIYQLPQWAWHSSHHELDKAPLLAGFVFCTRIAGAALAYGSQVLLARWMGGEQFGIYVYVWTWVLLLGCCVDLGLGSAAQRLVPQYIALQQPALLRGFLFGSHWLSLATSIAIGIIGALGVWSMQHQIDNRLVIPLFVACATLPALAIDQVQNGIARSYDWVGLALVPPFILRQTLLVGMIGLLFFSRGEANATWGMLISSFASWLSVAGAAFVLIRRLKHNTIPGPRSYNPAGWFSISVPIMAVETSFQLLSYVDVLMLMKLASPDDVATYYAATKTIALVSFIHFAIAATTTHRFSRHHVAGERQKLQALLTQVTRWTLWPSLAAIILLLIAGKPLLMLFGDGFTAGYPLMFILSLGLLARSAVGPAERLLSMIGEWRICAATYAMAFLLNVCLCVLLIPRCGYIGAGVAFSFALILEAILLSVLAKRHLGLRLGIFSRVNDTGTGTVSSTP